MRYISQIMAEIFDKEEAATEIIWYFMHCMYIHVYIYIL